MVRCAIGISRSGSILSVTITTVGTEGLPRQIRRKYGDMRDWQKYVRDTFGVRCDGDDYYLTMGETIGPERIINFDIFDAPPQAASFAYNYGSPGRAVAIGQALVEFINDKMPPVMEYLNTMTKIDQASLSLFGENGGRLQFDEELPILLEINGEVFNLSLSGTDEGHTRLADALKSTYDDRHKALDERTKMVVEAKTAELNTRIEELQHKLDSSFIMPDITYRDICDGLRVYIEDRYIVWMVPGTYAPKYYQKDNDTYRLTQSCAQDLLRKVYVHMYVYDRRIARMNLLYRESMRRFTHYHSMYDADCWGSLDLNRRIENSYDARALAEEALHSLGIINGDSLAMSFPRELIPINRLQFEQDEDGYREEASHGWIIGEPVRASGATTASQG